MPRLFRRGTNSSASFVTMASESSLFNETVLSTGVIMEGTLAARPAFGIAGRLYYATDTQALYKDSGAAWAALGATLTAEAMLGADVNIGAPNVYVDGPSISLIAGTWFIVGAVTCTVTGDARFTAKLWDGATVEATVQGLGGGGTSDGGAALAGLVVLGATATWKISVACPAGNAGSWIRAAAQQNGAGNNASHIRAHRVA